jgi:hypothetical protein
MTAVLLAPVRRWDCPNCWETTVTRSARPHTPFHQCRGLAGLRAPYVTAGTVCKVEAVERGDWVGAEQVQTDADGRPWMAVVTTRDDGQDCAVLAPLAYADKEQQ